MPQMRLVEAIDVHKADRIYRKVFYPAHPHPPRHAVWEVMVVDRRRQHEKAPPWKMVAV